MSFFYDMCRLVVKTTSCRQGIWYNDDVKAARMDISEKRGTDNEKNVGFKKECV
ncbi:hypothetical protein HMPREF3033_01691 [Veillonellaceae bacterium DNF00751]|nr:hypothetical protein HMPREF3033_01691 [Veillonellaceae bacterium DNF00751]